MKTGLKIGLGIAAVAAVVGVVFFVRNQNSPTKLSPFDKMTKDVLDPNTPAGKAQREYVKSVGGNPEDVDSLLSFVDYRKSNPNDAWTIAYNRKKAWLPDEIVSI
ncbi:MAG: hypothetical protein ACK47E_09365 [Cyclobacteriaceae bacterium]|jgi:hypothetical protein